MSQSVIQSVSQSVSQSVCQSIRQSVSQSVSQSVNQSVNQSVSQLVSQSVSQSVSQPARAPPHPFVGPFNSYLNFLSFACFFLLYSTFFLAPSLFIHGRCQTYLSRTSCRFISQNFKFELKFNFALQNLLHRPSTSSWLTSNKLKLLSHGHILNRMTCTPLLVTHCK